MAVSSFLAEAPLFGLLAAAAAVVGAVLTFVFRGLQRAESKAVFAARALLTNNETEFYLRLVRALPEHRVLAQVSMGALLKPGPGVPRAEQMRVRARFAQKIIDYVILDRRSQVVALIELDDRTHDAAKDAARDAMTRAAGYVTLRYLSSAKPSEEAIRADIEGLGRVRS